MMKRKNSTKNEINIAWLVNLRWLAAVSQILVLGITIFAFNIELPVLYLSSGILGLIASNILLQKFEKQGKENQNILVGCVLLFDTVLLTYLLYLTGGPANPFSILFLVHVALSSVMLSSFWTWCLVTTSVALFGGLFFFHRPLGDGHHHHHDEYSFHLYGMWIAYVVAAIATAYFLRRVMQLLRKRDDELMKLQTKQHHHERLVSLASLSAGTAHELATPLSTIAVVAKELERSLLQQANQDDSIADAKLIRSEVDRCREIISELGNNVGDSQAEALQRISIEKIKEELQSKFKQISNLQILIDEQLDSLHLPHTSLMHSLSSLVKNAIDASGVNDTVILKINRLASGVEFLVEDTGCGMDKELLSSVRDPFFSTKPTGKGLGLGLFLVDLFCERWNGKLELQSIPGEGTRASLILPSFEAETKKVSNG